MESAEKHASSHNIIVKHSREYVLISISKSPCFFAELTPIHRSARSNLFFLYEKEKDMYETENGRVKGKKERLYVCVCLKEESRQKGESSSIALEALEKVPSTCSTRVGPNLNKANWIEARTLL